MLDEFIKYPEMKTLFKLIPSGDNGKSGVKIQKGGNYFPN
jgi:hypothetical protein